MKCHITLNDLRWCVNLDKPVDLSIPLDFTGAQPNAFFLPTAEAKAFQAGDFVGDTREGGSVNCFDVTLNPHGNGTHTECVGHILHDRVHIGSIAPKAWLPAMVVSVPLTKLSESGDSYPAKCQPEDLVISRRALLSALTKIPGTSELGVPLEYSDTVEMESFEDVSKLEIDVPRSRHRQFLQALVIRTLPNSPDKKTRTHSGNNPAFFSFEAMEALCSLGVEHLLIDLPSVDREEDDGLLPTHHLFWGVPQGTHACEGPKSHKTITEMIFVPEGVQDGRYVLDLQIPHFLLDAAPSRPLLYGLEYSGE